METLNIKGNFYEIFKKVPCSTLSQARMHARRGYSSNIQKHHFFIYFI